MHDALLISEVLGRIIYHLEEDTVLVQRPDTPHAKLSRRVARRALAALARTCRAFSEPALDAIWRSLHGLENFVLSLPTYDSDNELVVLDDEAWKSMSRYTHRVQQLTIDDDELSIAILQSLLFRTTLLLPNLRKLDWECENFSSIAAMRLLLSPSLVHLHVYLGNGDHISVLTLLECYHTLSPNLKSLNFKYDAFNARITTAVSRAIPRSPNLEALTCESIDEAALIHITQSRCLRRLHATLLNYQSDNLRRLADFATPNHPPFENLCVLELLVQDLSSILPYLKSHQQPFEDVSFEFHEPLTHEVLHEFFTALSSPTRRRTLRRIKLLSRAGTSLQAVDFQLLSLLMPFDLHFLDMNSPVTLDDDELVRLVQAWPDLEALLLSHGRDDETSRIPTLRGPLLLSARCPKLRKLRLCIDARNIPSLSDDESLICNPILRKLSLPNSPIQEPVKRVARFLLQHFPSLIRLPTSEGQSGLWRDVSALIRKMNGYGSSDDESESSNGDGYSDSDSDASDASE